MSENNFNRSPHASTSARTFATAAASGFSLTYPARRRNGMTPTTLSSTGSAFMYSPATQ
jgi:hypothetical protein